LPRGLGEDPLVRQKKVRRRSAAQSAVLAPTPDSSGNVSSTQAPVQVGTTVDVSSSRPTSYNDVFFRKRSESHTVVVSSDLNHDVAVPAASDSAVAQSMIVEPIVAEPVLPEPIAAVALMTIPAVEAPVTSIFNPLPNAAETFTPISDIPMIQEDAHVETFTPANVAETFTPAPDTPLIQQEANVAQPSAPTMDAVASAPALQTATLVAEPETQKSGFFKRIFGRFQK
jgi:hypothetical protein